jgi:hypothetical protein
MKINWMNRIENTVIIVLCLIAVKFIMIKPLENHLIRQNQTIEYLAEREKYSYQILNQFEKKIKAKNGQIILDLNNDMAITNSHEITSLPRDSLPVNDTSKIKISFWQKLKFWNE